MKNSIEISKKAQEDINNICFKFNYWANDYVDNINDADLKNRIIKQTDALLFKFISIGINLEHLWEIKDYKKDISSNVNSISNEWENIDSFIDVVFLENTVIQVRSFIDFAQKLSCVVLGYQKNFIGTKEFYKILKKIDSKKSKMTLLKFEEILEEGNWGAKVKSIRDKISHYDIIKTNSSFRPKIQNLNYEQFCQRLQNDTFELLCDLTEILFERKWVSGYL